MLSVGRALCRLVALLIVAATLTLGVAGTPATAAVHASEKPKPAVNSDGAAAPIRGVDLTADFDAVIKGLVYDEDGNLIDNIQVEAISTDDPTADPVSSDFTYEEADSASHGAYQLYVPAGTYKIRFSSPDWARRSFETVYYGGGSGDDVTVAAGETKSLADVTLVRDAGAPVTGTIRDTGGNALPNVEVALFRFYDDSWFGYDSVDWTKTNASGQYTFDGVNHNRSYSVLAYGTYSYEGDYLGFPDTWLGDVPNSSAAQRFSLPSGSTGQALAAITLRPGAEVHGTVSEPDGQHSSGYADLLLRNPDGSYDSVDYTYVGYDGTFSFPTVARNETYTVGIFSWDGGGETTYLGNVSAVDAADTVDVLTTDTSVDVGNIAIGTDTTKVTGSVVDADGDGVPYSDLIVWEQSGDGTFEQVRYASSHWDGSFALRLPWGHTYTIEADPWSDTAGVFLGDVTDIEDATTFTTTTGEQTLAVGAIHVTRLFNKLVGQVVDVDNEPVAGATVRLWSDYCDGTCWDQYDSATTNDNGRYVFRYLDSDASYTVSAQKPNLGYDETFVGGTDNPEDATAYAAPNDGESVTADPITLTMADGSVLGSIDTSDGEPLDGYTDLDLYTFADDGAGGYYLDYVDSTYTGDASFGFTHVPAGSFTIQANYYDNDWNDPHRYARTWLGGARPTSPDSAGVFTVDEAVNPTTGITITLDRGIELSGTVTAPSGAPVTDADVYVFEWVNQGDYDYPEFLASAYTDGDGHYAVRVSRNTDLFVEAYSYGYKTYFLGGENPYEQTADNTMTTGDANVVHDFTMFPAPVNTEEPTITGTLEPGSTLTVLPGTWTLDGAPADGLTFSYSWYHTAVGSEEDTYVLQEGDAGHRVRVQVRASLEGYDDQYAYASVRVPAGPPVAENTVAPSLAPENPAVGDTLTADRGEWTPSDGGSVDDLTFSYRWFRNGHRIRSASGEVYETRDADELKAIFVRVVASRDGFANVRADSAPVSVASPTKPVLEPSEEPVLTGLAKVGETLTLDPGTWNSGGADVTHTYKWVVGYQTRNADSGSGGLAYTLTASDQDALVTAYVTASADGFRKGTWSTTVGPVVAANATLTTLTIHVQDQDSDAPLAGASVYACDYESWTCLPGGETDASGDYSGQALAGSTYYVYVYPSDDAYHTGEAQVLVSAAGTTATVEVFKPAPPPENVFIPTSNGSYGGVPTVHYTVDQVFNVRGCAGVSNPAYTVTFSDGSPTVTGPMTVTQVLDGGLSMYNATIPAFYPAHGDTVISTNIPADCDPSTPPTTINIYIDPSGVITDQYGRPIDGASATLLRSETAGGPYTEVPDGSDVMSPDNRNNPTITDEAGFFQWDVIEGWYRVRAEADGCTPNSTGPMQVNPPQVDLLIKLDCAAAAPSVTPTITGTPKVGNTLTTNEGAWPSLFSVSVQWLRDGAVIAGATGHTYAVTSADRNHAVTVRQSADRPDYVQDAGRGGPVDFTAVAPVSAPVTPALGDAPTATTQTVVSGSGKVDTVLTATPPAWNTDGVVNSRQWLSDGQPIAGQSGTTYTVVAGDVGKAISIRFIGAKDGFADGTSTSNAVTGVLGDAPTSAAPMLGGVAKTGQQLTVDTPSWNTSGVTTGYQWLRDGSAIADATGTAYTLVAGDVGKAISVRATGTKPGYTPGQSTSATVIGQLGDAATTTTAPTVTGTGKVAQTLSATSGTWNAGGLAYSYQWLRDGAAITDATGTAYLLTAADAARSISVLVTAARPGHADGTATSEAISVAKLGSATTAKLSKAKIPHTKTGSLKLTVKVPGVAGPTGTVKIYDGKKVIKTVKLVAGNKGALTVKLPKLKKGKHKLVASYLGSSAIAGSKSRAVILTVT